MVLVVKGLVLLRVVLDLALQGLNLLVKLHYVQILHIFVVLESLCLFSEQSDGVLKFLTVAVPVLEVFHVLECGEVERWDSHLYDVFLRASVTYILVVQAEVHLHVPLKGKFVLRLCQANLRNVRHFDHLLLLLLLFLFFGFLGGQVPAHEVILERRGSDFNSMILVSNGVANTAVLVQVLIGILADLHDGMEHFVATRLDRNLDLLLQLFDLV